MKISIFYDDSCILCTTNSRQMQDKNPRDIHIVPVHEAIDTLKNAGVSMTDAMTYLCVQDETGKVYKHMDAVQLVYQTAGMRFAPWLSAPVIRPFCDWAYPIVARNRYRFPRFLIHLLYGRVATAQVCENGVCQLPPERRARKSKGE